MDCNIEKEVKHDEGSVIVWGCLTSKGTDRLHRIHGNMNAVQYCNILDESLLRTLSDHGMNKADIIFQQDNDLKHTSAQAKKWFEENDITVLPWPSFSSDMNIIEHA